MLLHLKFPDGRVYIFSLLLVTPEPSSLGWEKPAWLFHACITAAHGFCWENADRLLVILRIGLLSSPHPSFFTLACPSSAHIIFLTTKIFQSSDLKHLLFNSLDGFYLPLGDDCGHPTWQEVLGEGHRGVCHVERKEEVRGYRARLVTGWDSGALGNGLFF